jgi:DNA-binding MarR family transcriptional regulator
VTKKNERRLRVLAEFRSVLRGFLQFSEEAAARVGLTAQQHQLLLQVSGVPEGEDATVAYVAGRLGVRHHSAVGLSKRCEEAGLIERRHDAQDARFVVLRATAKGERLLEELSAAHGRELHSLALDLITSLERIRRLEKR